MTCTITVFQLKSLEACSGEVQLFRITFGDTLVISSKEHAKELALQWYKRFSFDWAGRNLLSDPALEKYLKVRLKVRAAARKDYLKVRDAARKEYNKVCDPAWKEYLKVRDPAWKEYEKVRAITFMELYYEENNQ